MISLADYYGIHSKSIDLTPGRRANAQRLLTAVNRLIALGMKEGLVFPVNPNTKSQVSGETYGGFRPQDCKIGAPNSAHKECQAIDLYDPNDGGAIDTWLMTSKAAKELYEDLGLYFESPSATIGWSHWSIRRPASGSRFFKP